MLELNSHKNIITTSSVVQLISNKQPNINNYYNYLEYNLGCTYLFYIYEDVLNDKKIIYTSNWDWQNYLIGEKLINECPVFKAGNSALSTGRQSSILLPWNNIPCQTSLEKDIVLLRGEFNISNGIGISYTNGIIREGIGLGADIKDLKFYQRVIKNNEIYDILRRVRFLLFKKKHNTLH